MPLTLVRRAGELAICRLGHNESVPAWATRGDFYSITYTPEELSIVCDAAGVPDTVKAERTFTALRVEGTVAFTVTGLLAALSAPLATARIPIFVVSTYDTDYLLVRTSQLDVATDVLRATGIAVK